MSIASYNSPIATNVRKLIKQKDLKQGAIATRAGFTEQSFCDILNGRRLVKASEIPLIATALGVEPNDLYGIYIQSTNTYENKKRQLCNRKAKL